MIGYCFQSMRWFKRSVIPTTPECITAAGGPGRGFISEDMDLYAHASTRKVRFRMISCQRRGRLYGSTQLLF